MPHLVSRNNLTSGNYLVVYEIHPNGNRTGVSYEVFFHKVRYTALIIVHRIQNLTPGYADSTFTPVLVWRVWLHQIQTPSIPADVVRANIINNVNQKHLLDALAIDVVTLCERLSTESRSTVRAREFERFLEEQPEQEALPEPNPEPPVQRTSRYSREPVI